MFQWQAVPTESSPPFSEISRRFCRTPWCFTEGGEVCELGETKGVLLLEILVPGSLYPGAICRCLPGD